MAEHKKPFLAHIAREVLPEPPEAGRYDESQQISVSEDAAIPIVATDEGRNAMASLPNRQSGAPDGGTIPDN